MRRSSFARIATETTGYASSCLFNQSNWVSRTTYTNCGVQNLRERVIGMDILQYQYQLQQLTPVSISIPTPIPRCNQLDMKLPLWVHDWKPKPKSTDRLSIHSCISRSTFLNVRDPTFPIGARRQPTAAGKLVQSLSTLDNDCKQGVSDACHDNNTLRYRSAPVSPSLSAANGAGGRPRLKL